MGKEIKIGLVVISGLLCLFGGALYLRLRHESPVSKKAVANKQGPTKSPDDAAMDGSKDKGLNRRDAGDERDGDEGDGGEGDGGDLGGLGQSAKRKSLFGSEPTGKLTAHSDSAAARQGSSAAFHAAADEPAPEPGGNAWLTQEPADDAATTDGDLAADEGVGDEQRFGGGAASAAVGDRYARYASQTNAAASDEESADDAPGASLGAADGELVADETVGQTLADGYRTADEAGMTDAADMADTDEAAVEMPQDRFQPSATDERSDADFPSDGLAAPAPFERNDSQVRPLSGDARMADEPQIDEQDDERPTLTATSGAQSLEAGGGDRSYRVEANDNFWRISQKVYGTGAYFKALREYNRQRYAGEQVMNVGDEVTVPALDTLRQSFPALCPKQRAAAARPATSLVKSVSGPRRGRDYTVAEGDTLFDIARHELSKASRWSEIYELNREQLGDDFNYLAPGMRLALPGDGPKSDPVTTRIDRDRYQR
jgi:nucleoid-associated protein YgaU